MFEVNIGIIQSIIDSIAISSERKIFFNGNELPFFQQHQEPALPSDEMLLQALQQLIYREFYCKYTGKDPVDAEIKLNDDFIKRLQAANLSKERWDKNWLVDDIDHRGVLSIKKGDHFRNAYAGEFIKEDFSHQYVWKGEKVRLFVRREYSDISQPFYHFFGETVAEENSEFLVRFYFNLQPKGSPLLVGKTTSLFNKYLIPFQAKCVADPLGYNRTDTAVLYLDKRYFKQGIVMILNIHKELTKYLRDQCPLFTKKIANGLSFAENPPGHEVSFGTTRCKLIAHGILSAFTQHLPKTGWLKSVLVQVELKGYSMSDFYLSPNSHFPYTFPNL